MSEVDKLVEKVVAESGKSEKEIRKQMTERKERTHGLLSDYGAIYAVAKEHGIELSDSEGAYTPLSKLKPQNSANLVGTVKAVYSEREFGRKDGSSGKFASTLIVDDTGEMRIVLWDPNTSIVSKLRVGDTLLVKNGFVKENRGSIEVHAGSLTNLTINPKNLSVKLPKLEEKIDQIKSLEAGLPSVNIVCRVSSYFPKTEFQRSDGSKGGRASFIAEDEGGKTRVILWDPLADAEIAEGDIVKLENAYTREGINGDVEVQAGSRSRISKTDAKLKLKPLPQKKTGAVKINEIKPDMNGFDIDARVLRVYEPREYSRGMMASLILGDETGTIRAVLWNENSEAASKLKEGDGVRIKNAYAKANNMNNEAEVHLGKYSKIKAEKDVKAPTAGEINENMAEEKNIVDLDSSDRFVRIKGKIVQIEEKPMFYMTCNECSKKVQNVGGEWMCDECGIVEGTPNMIASIVIEDKSGNIRAVAFKDKAEKILHIDVEEAMNLIGETQDDNAPLAVARERIVGKEIILLGRVNYNEYSDQLEFMISEAN